MKELQERIKKDGIAINEDILKVDSFINHQVDPELMAHIGAEFADHFKNRGITKVATIESSGIAPALMAAQAMGHGFSAQNTRVCRAPARGTPARLGGFGAARHRRAGELSAVSQFVHTGFAAAAA